MLHIVWVKSWISISRYPSRIFGSQWGSDHVFASLHPHRNHLQSCHKWLYAKRGCSLLYVQRRCDIYLGSWSVSNRLQKPSTDKIRIPSQFLSPPSSIYTSRTTWRFGMTFPHRTLTYFGPWYRFNDTRLRVFLERKRRYLFCPSYFFWDAHTHPIPFNKLWTSGNG